MPRACAQGLTAAYMCHGVADNNVLLLLLLLLMNCMQVVRCFEDDDIVHVSGKVRSCSLWRLLRECDALSELHVPAVAHVQHHTLYEFATACHSSHTAPCHAVLCIPPPKKTTPIRLTLLTTLT